MTPRIHADTPPQSGLSEDLLQRAARAVLERAGVDDGELSITCLPDHPIRGLNRRWLGHDWVPDVLAFALHEPGGAPIGDIYIGIEQADRQAHEHGVTLAEELARLAIHGTLHVLGYDHPEDHAAREDSDMYRIQEAVLASVLGTDREADDRAPGRGGAGEDAT